MKPKFSVFKNLTYCVYGFVNLVKEETSFKIHLATLSLVSIALCFTSFSLPVKLILFTSFFLVLIGEAINSAIERIVDLVSPGIHPLAKNAKDIGAFIVMLFYIMNVLIWLIAILS